MDIFILQLTHLSISESGNRFEEISVNTIIFLNFAYKVSTILSHFVIHKHRGSSLNTKFSFSSLMLVLLVVFRSNKYLEYISNFCLFNEWFIYVHKLKY